MFLESLAADRAQSVRDSAQMLLARLPGTSAYQKKLEQARDKIEIKKTGLLRRRAVLSLLMEPRPGATHTDPLFQTTIDNREMFHGLRLADLASALNMSVEELIAGSVESAGLGPLILKSAIIEGVPVDPKLFSSLSIGDAVHSTVFLLKEVLPEAAGSMRNALLEFALSPGNWSTLPAPVFFEQVYSSLREPLPSQVASDLIRSSIWRDAFGENGEASAPHWAVAVAPLIPRTLSEEFIRGIEPHSRRAVLYHHLLLALPETDMRT
jgi:hypothetical protein